MAGAPKNIFSRPSLVAIAVGLVGLAGAGQAASAQSPTSSASPERPLTFTVPLVYNEKVLGDVLIDVRADNEVLIDTETLRQELGELLNEEGRSQLDQAIWGKLVVCPEQLASIGIEIRFDKSMLELRLDRVPGALRPVQSLNQREVRSASADLPVVQPSRFSTYLNINANVDYSSEDNGGVVPDFFLSGATRVGAVAFEYDGAFTDQFTDGYRFYRRGFRAVFDQPEKHRRFAAGDLRVESLSLLQTPFIGGVSVEKNRRIFDPFLPVSSLGGREIFLDNRSNVDVLINGEKYQTFQLEAGRYDLSDLPVRVGANDVKLLVKDSTGREQTIDFNFFFKQLRLRVGEEQYSFAAGFLAEEREFEPDYSGSAAFSGLYRRGISENLVLGGAMQISQDVQVLGIETSFVPQVIPGDFDVQAAISNGDDGTGFAVNARYSFRSGNSFENTRQLTVSLDYESTGFQTISDVIPSTFNLLSLNANYTQSLSRDTFVNAGLAYTQGSGQFGSRTTVFADVVHRLNDKFRLKAGVEYGKDNFNQSNFGIRLSLSMAFGGSHRASADYRSRSKTFRANLSKGNNDSVGSFGYDLGISDVRGQSSADASVDYIANRFEARASVITDGTSFGNIADRQSARLQIGTSLAFADGAFGIGRPINDSFAVVTPHESLGKRKIITGRSLSENEYDARSGILGGAVQSDLSSYNAQDVQYDVDSAQPGYDIGDGTVRVEPPFKAGYKIEVGSANFVSVVGVLNDGAEPVALATGVLRAIKDENFEAIPFFTNSAGRFGLMGLAPGKTYEILLNNGERRFEIAVPADNDGLYRVGTIELSTKPK
ncbi:fimbria/pilus outer membrane usher protein [Parasphingorhabdus flavimaris]|uniref:fimbria/pilus outer membrane usher protein n=1 Tax=Parasphingorhabdus flavimaris TaxID=266812 RepID=UPI003002CFCF